MTTIKNFPEEVLRMVFEKLEHSDRTVCQEVCKAWYSPAHRLLLNNINLDNSVAVLRFISSIDHNPDPRYLKSVRRICIKNSNAMDPLNRINFRKLFCRFPNLESVQIIHNFTLLHELNDELCKELLKSCTRLGEFEVIPNTIHRVQYVSLLKKIKTLVTTIYIDQCVLEQFGHPQQFIGDFPRLQKVCGDISSRLYNFGAFFPVLAKAPHLKRIMLDGVDEEEDVAETLLKSKRKQEREQISETLANFTHLNVNCRNGFSTNSVEFISKHMTGLENFHFVTKFNDSLVDLQHVKNILEIVNRAKEFGYFRLKKIQIDILKPLLPRIINYTFRANSTRKRVLHMKVLDRNDFDLVINSREQRETTIEVTVKNERSIKKMMEYNTRKVLNDFDKFILEFKKRKQTDRKDATTIQLYTSFLEKMPAIKELVADVPASYVEKETINYKFNRKYEGIVHENLESLTLRATENGNIQSMLNGFAPAFPNLKDLNLQDYSGRWDETLGEFQLLLTGYSLKKLELDLAPVKRKMIQYLGDQAKQESMIIDVQILESGEQSLFEVTSDLVIAKKIEGTDLVVAKDLALKFKKVYGTDTPKTMISSAVERDNISYSVLGAEEIASAFKESSIDVITVGQAFHWLKNKQFFDAAKHVLKPGGTLAIIGYGFVAVKGSPAATKLIKDLGEVKLKDYWEPGRELVNNLYRDIEYPFKTVEWHITPEEADTIYLNQGNTDESFLSTDISIEALGNYLKTWSSYFIYLKKTGDAEDLVDKVITEIMSVMNLKDSKEIIQIEFPTALILCRNQKD